jgi:hypothetical protein
MQTLREGQQAGLRQSGRTSMQRLLAAEEKLLEW